MPDGWTVVRSVDLPIEREAMLSLADGTQPPEGVITWRVNPVNGVGWWGDIESPILHLVFGGLIESDRSVPLGIVRADIGRRSNNSVAS